MYLISKTFHVACVLQNTRRTIIQQVPEHRNDVGDSQVTRRTNTVAIFEIGIEALP